MFWKNDWITLDIVAGANTVYNDYNNPISTSTNYYLIQYSRRKEKYRVKCIGKGAKKSHVYGEALALLAAYNSGEALTPNYTKYLDREPDMGDLPQGAVGTKVYSVPIPLGFDMEYVKQFIMEDTILEQVTKSVLENLKQNSTCEIFEVDKNFIATSEGHFICLYEEDANVVMQAINSDEGDEDEGF